MLLNCNKVSKSYGDRVLLDDASFTVEKGDILGLVGANGVGKTTLFRMIKGEEEPDDGSFIFSPYLKIGYLEQYVCDNSERTTYEEAISVFSELFLIEDELADIREKLNESPDPELIKRQDDLLEEYEKKDGLIYKSLTRSVLTGLGFSEEEQALPVSSLSGGQKSKIGLARLLLGKPDLMLLDEPTNHLDMSSVEWLEKFISGSGITTIVISHDRYFLDRVATSIAEITGRKIYYTEGDYSRHMELKAERDKAEGRHYENVMAEVHRLEGVIEQQRRWNREKNIKTAESKQKQIDRLMEGLEKPENERFDYSFFFSPGLESGDEVLSLKNVKKEYPGKVLYENVSFDIRKGDKVFILGDNGIGKTTLINQIMKRAPGVKYGVGVKTGYFDQHQLNLTLSNTIFDEVQGAYPKMNDTEIRSALAVFGLKGEKVFERLSSLSGGERAKVSLCKLMLKKCNLLILDEPTNHLDIYSMAALEEALKGYEGTLLVISHDRYFINRLAGRILRLETEGVKEYKGNYDEYLLQLESEKADSPEETAEKTEKSVGRGGQEYINRKKLRSMRTKARTALKRTEEEIEETEALIEKLGKEMEDPENGTDFEKISELSKALDDAGRKLDAAMAKWEELALEVSGYED